MTETSFEWKQGGKNVLLYGEWDAWSQGKPLIQQGGIHHTQFKLEPRVYQYKFTVDGAWVYDIEKPSITTQGITNNVVKVLHPDSPRVVVTLGERLTTDGGPSFILIDRVAKAVEYVKEDNKVKLVIFTGGKVSSKNHPSEAEVMQKLAVEQGLPEDIIVLEDKASNTIENAYNTKKILQSKFKECGVVLITTNFHMQRASIIFSSVLGYEYPVSSVSVPDEVSLDERSIKDRKNIESWLMPKLQQDLGHYKQIMQTL